MLNQLHLVKNKLIATSLLGRYYLLWD